MGLTPWPRGQHIAFVHIGNYQKTLLTLKEPARDRSAKRISEAGNLPRSRRHIVPPTTTQPKRRRTEVHHAESLGNSQAWLQCERGKGIQRLKTEMWKSTKRKIAKKNQDSTPIWTKVMQMTIRPMKRSVSWSQMASVRQSLERKEFDATAFRR
jgi:hypothetical protein